MDSHVPMKLLKSTGLVLAPIAALIVFGLHAFLAIWTVVIGLFVFSRLSQGAALFTEWSWSQFLLTIGLGVGVPYILLLLSSGF